MSDVIDTIKAEAKTYRTGPDGNEQFRCPLFVQGNLTIMCRLRAVPDTADIEVTIDDGGQVLQTTTDDPARALWRMAAVLLERHNINLSTVAPDIVGNTIEILRVFDAQTGDHQAVKARLGTPRIIVTTPPRPQGPSIGKATAFGGARIGVRK